MKKVEAINVVSGDGTKTTPADTYYRWNKIVAGKEFEFALHADPSTVPPRKLFISEVSTGATLGLGPIHPKYGTQLTESAFSKSHSTYLPGNRIKHLSRSALHNTVARVGYEKFIESIDMATFQIMAARSQQLANVAAEKGFTIDMSKIKAERDSVEDRLEYLQAQRKKLEDQWDVTERTPEELEELDAKLAQIDDQIEPLMRLETMRARLDALTDLREQHGTMTGDTTDGDFEEICDNIATLECEIAELEELHGV